MVIIGKCLQCDWRKGKSKYRWKHLTTLSHIKMQNIILKRKREGTKFEALKKLNLSIIFQLKKLNSKTQIFAGIYWSFVISDRVIYLI